MVCGLTRITTLGWRNTLRTDRDNPAKANKPRHQKPRAWYSPHQIVPGSAGFVVFEDTGEERIVIGRCRVCYPYGAYQTLRQLVVSPNGLAHQEGYYGNTVCGKDATGDKWWWPL